VVWETVSGNVKNVAGWNRWPSPYNFIKNIRILVCNQDSWMAEIELAVTMAVYMFWNDFFPSPREVERKVFTGGYRCGFILDIPIKSPIEIIFGKGTARMVGEIAAPFAKALFYWWVAATAYESLSAFTSIIFPQLFCTDNLGDAERSNDRGALGSGEHSGVPGLGFLNYDYREIMSLTDATCFFPAGYWRVIAMWLLPVGEGPFDYLRVGIKAGDDTYDMTDVQHGPTNVLEQIMSESSGQSDQPITVSAWIEYKRPIGVLPVTVECVRYIAYWSPTPWPPNTGKLQTGTQDDGPRLYPDCYGNQVYE